MAVPKKRTSSSKTKSRHATWVNKAIIQRERATVVDGNFLQHNLLITPNRKLWNRYDNEFRRWL